MDDFTNITIETGNAFESYLCSAQLLRGKILTHFSHVEFMLADFHFRAISLPEYASIRFDLPYRVKSRVAAVKKILDMAGPLYPYRDAMLKVTDDILSFEDLRQFMAHGNMLVDFKNPGYPINFIVFDQPKGSGPILKTKSFSIESLSVECIDVGKYSISVLEVFHWIVFDLPLPAAPFGKVGS